jgi:hypothetical protein
VNTQALKYHRSKLDEENRYLLALVLLIAVGYERERVGKDTVTLASEKTNVGFERV